MSKEEARRHTTNRLARLVLATFVFTFIISRILVILIMAGKLPPQLFFHVKGTHVHHLNYGIALLSLSGALLLFVRPTGKALSFLAVIYGLGLGLTFDEFGMWLHLGGPYWQSISFDAVTVVAAMLALVAYGSTLHRWEAKHHLTAAVLIVFLCAFGYVLNESRHWAHDRLAPVFEHLEEQGPL
jgi:hypothetical protein